MYGDILREQRICARTRRIWWLISLLEFCSPERKIVATGMERESQKTSSRRPFKQLGLKRNRALSALERHYSVRQVAELWCWSDDTVRRRFRHEPGVIAI